MPSSALLVLSDNPLAGTRLLVTRWGGIWLLFARDVGTETEVEGEGFVVPGWDGWGVDGCELAGEL